MSWSPVKPEGGPLFFFGSSPSYLIFGTGSVGLSGPALTALRARIDRDGDAFVAALENAKRSTGADFSDFGAPPLKRVPKPYAPEHPHGELLKRKSFTITAPLPTNWQNDGLVPSVLTVAKALEPVRAWLADG